MSKLAKRSRQNDPGLLPRKGWTIREWGSFSSVIGTIVLLWLTFGPRNKQLTGGS